MLILLPPSETKRDGGDPERTLDLAALSFPALTRPRREAIAGMRRVSKSVASATRALGLGPTQRFEIDRNRALGNSPTMPAIERYTGVLFDALDVHTLDEEARRRASSSVLVHSALFGLLRADDPVPAYRFSHDSRVPGLRLAQLWAEANTGVLISRSELILDFRSEAYVHLGPAPASPVSHFLRVVTETGAGVRRALNHFNKHGKGEFTRRLLQSGENFDSVDDLLAWARNQGLRLERGAPGELELVV